MLYLKACLQWMLCRFESLSPFTIGWSLHSLMYHKSVSQYSKWSVLLNICYRFGERWEKTLRNTTFGSNICCTSVIMLKKCGSVIGRYIGILSTRRIFALFWRSEVNVISCKFVFLVSKWHLLTQNLVSLLITACVSFFIFVLHISKIF